MKPLWYPSEDLDAQFAHALAGMTAVFGAQALWPGYWWMGAIGILIFAALKEFLFDALIEQQPFHVNLRDFGFYMLGAALSAIAMVVKLI
jgi:hypothetical protein